MGREVKRVSKDFDWPLKITWKGYINPYKSIECKLCDGTGLNEKTKLLEDEWYGSEKRWCDNLDQEDVQALIDVNRLWDFTRVPINEEQREILKKEGGYWLPFNNGYIPTAKEVNEWNQKGMGHDSINKYVCVDAKAKRLGFYGECKLCDGNCCYWAEDKYEKLSKDWERIEPPEGEYYQIWETVSEGSPITPPLETPEKLAEWCVKNGVSSGISNTLDYDTWMKFIKESGWAVSMVMENGKIKSGVEAVTDAK